MSNLAKAATGAVEASFDDISSGRAEAGDLIEAAYMAASAVEEEMAQDALKRLLDIIKDQTSNVRKAFQNKHGNPCYRQRALEELAESEKRATDSKTESVAKAAPDAPSGAVTAVDVARVLDVLNLTRGLLEAA